MAPVPVLSPRQTAFIASLATGATQTEAAATIGLSTRQARRYWAEPKVRMALKDATDDTLAAASRRMGWGTAAAMGVLARAMGEAGVPMSVRIRAAEVWLAYALKTREIVDLAERMAALERMMQQDGDNE